MTKDMFLKILICTLAFLGWVFLMGSISGCTPNQTIHDNNQLRDKNFTQGCQITQGALTFDSYFDTTTGKATTCIVRCSPELPKNFSYKYNNPMTGCNVEIVK